jgi:hypothetical protein
MAALPTNTSRRRLNTGTDSEASNASGPPSQPLPCDGGGTTTGASGLGLLLLALALLDRLSSVGSAPVCKDRESVGY